MTSPEFLIMIGAICAVSAVAALRLAWSRPKRNVALTGAGWALMGLAVASGAADSGAWGIAIVSLVAMGAAMIALAVAVATTPSGNGENGTVRKPSARPYSPRHIGRRVATFLMVAVVALLVSVGIGLAAYSLGIEAGLSKADSNVLAMTVMPLAWAVLSYFVLAQPTRRGQWILLLATSVPAWPLLVTG